MLLKPETRSPNGSGSRVVLLREGFAGCPGGGVADRILLRLKFLQTIYLSLALCLCLDSWEKSSLGAAVNHLLTLESVSQQKFISLSTE